MKNLNFPIFSRIAVLLVMLATSFEVLGQEKTEEVDLTLRPDPKGGKTVVEVSIRVLDIDEIDGANQSFSANVVVVARWHDSRLASDEDHRTMALSEVWNPMLQITNQQRLLKTFPDTVVIRANGKVEWIQRYWGKFSQPLDLHEFPLDEHTFSIQFVSAGADFENVELKVPEEEGFRSGLAEKLSLPDWEVTEWNVKTAKIKLFKGANSLSSASFEFHAKRYVGYYLVKVLLPLLMIVMMSWIVFWIHPSESGSQISVSITSMLTLIAYRFALGAMLPKVSYITRMDGFILFATIMVFVALMEAVTTSRLVRGGNEDMALKVDRFCRVLFPCIFIVACVYAVWG